jgi:hypothetical protein
MPIFPLILLAAGLVGGGLVGRYVIPANDYTSCVNALIAAGINANTAAADCQPGGTQSTGTSSLVNSVLKPLIVPGIIFGSIWMFGPMIIKGFKTSITEAVTYKPQVKTQSVQQQTTQSNLQVGVK